MLKEETNNQISLPLRSVIGKKLNYDLIFDDGETKVTLLKRAKAPYEISLIDEKKKFAVIRKKRDINDYVFFILDMKRWHILRNSTTDTKFIKYNAKTNEIFFSSSLFNHYTPVSRKPSEERLINIPITSKLLQANKNPKSTIIIDQEGNAKATPLIKITSKNSKAPKSSTKLVVQVKNVKDFYNEVFVNDERVLPEHIDTQIKILADKTLLAIHCTINIKKNKKDKISQWLVYDTDMNLLGINHNKKTIIQNVEEKNGKVVLTLSDGSVGTLNLNKMKNISSGRKFMLKQNTR